MVTCENWFLLNIIEMWPVIYAFDWLGLGDEGTPDIILSVM